MIPKFLHVIRDGRDVACSLVTMNWINPATGQKSWHTQSIANAARYWRQTVETARRQAAHPSLAGRVLEVRYEQLVAQTEETLRKVLAFVGEPWHEGVLNYHEKAQDRDGEPLESSTSDTCKPVYRKATGRWRREMSVPDRIVFAREAGNLLEQLGYVRDPLWWRPPLDTWAISTVQVPGPMLVS